MTQPRRLHNPRRLRAHVPSALTVFTLAALTALAPAVLAGGTTIVVTAFPGGGWIVSPDNTPGGSVELVPFTEPGTLGNGAIELTTAATADFAGVADPFFPVGIPYSDLTAIEWRTFVSGDTGNPTGEAASVRLSGYQDGFSVFTTLTAELALNGGATPDVWQDNTLADGTTVWQTTDNGDGFCLQTGPGCTFGEFKDEYPAGRFSAVQVAIGTGLPPVTSWTDGVTLSIMEDGTETTETFDFDVAAAPTPTPTPTPSANPVPSDAASATPVATPASGAGGGGGSDGAVPDTSTDASTHPASVVGIALGSLVLLVAASIAIVRRPRPSR